MSQKPFSLDLSKMLTGLNRRPKRRHEKSLPVLDKRNSCLGNTLFTLDDEDPDQNQNFNFVSQPQLNKKQLKINS